MGAVGSRGGGAPPPSPSSSPRPVVVRPRTPGDDDGGGGRTGVTVRCHEPPEMDDTSLAALPPLPRARTAAPNDHWVPAVGVTGSGELATPRLAAELPDPRAAPTRPNAPALISSTWHPNPKGAGEGPLPAGATRPPTVPAASRRSSSNTWEPEWSPRDAASDRSIRASTRTT